MLRIRAVALAVTAIAVPAAAAAPAPAATNDVVKIKLRGGASALRLAPATANGLAALGVAVTPISGAEALGKNQVGFNITSGRLAGKQPEDGYVRHNGGIRLTDASHRIDLNNLRINDGDPSTITVQVGDGERIHFAKLGFKGAEFAVTKRRFAFTDVTVKLDAPGAAALNTAFGTTAFAEGATLGTLTTVARIRLTKS